MSSQDETPSAAPPDPAAHDVESPPTVAAADVEPALTPDADPATPDADPAAPDADQLDQIAAPAVLRRAPRYGAFVRTGVLIGAVVGWLLALLFPFAPDAPGAAVIAITALALGCVGALLGAAVAVLVERRG